MNTLDELEMLIQDEHTVVSFYTNGASNGEYVLTADAFIRPKSEHRDKFLNPHRTFGDLPMSMVKQCPACQEDWTQIHKVSVDLTQRYCCTVSICDSTYAQVKNRNLYGNNKTGETMARNTEEEEELLFFNLLTGEITTTVEEEEESFDLTNNGSGN